MSGTATIAITVGVAVAVLVGFFIVYYLGNVANSIYDVKVGVRKDFDKKVKELQEWVEKDTKQRVNWMRDENKSEGKRFKESMEGHLEETFGEMTKELERLRADITSLQVQMQNMQQKQGVKPSYNHQVNSSMAASSGGSNPLGDLEVPRVMVAPSEQAPDMAAVIDKSNPSMGAAAAEKTAIKSKPSPPPPPTSKQPAGRTSVEEKNKQKQKKKRRDPDAFESFNQFSEDFKAGS
ncbi:MAG: hypothetical protein ACNI26_07420 [Terasakiella sp.]|uniref:hypothetical protein n=1 Tax=unclassified Terasakiella TaxID=2614952 RepID=UPI003B0100AD